MNANPPASSVSAVGAVISNGTVRLGVNDLGHLITGGVGLEYLPTGNEALNIGCDCEGWGVADAGTGVQGYASIDLGTSNVTPVSFTSTANKAVSTVKIGNTFKVTHTFRPSKKSPFLFQGIVGIKNISGQTLTDVRYSRVMDWDVEPTPFSEFVTNQGHGSDPTLLYDSNNGFTVPAPLSGRIALGASGNFVDYGPRDQGAAFDFGFGVLAPGEKKQFKIFYGAAGTEADALAAIAADECTVYSLGQANTDPAGGTPTTFIFCYRSEIHPFAE